MLPIPGTSSVEHLVENIKAQELSLSPEEVSQLEALAK
jgi:aryl-alcohol dehydrogenase-like predicted oxidoreductase